MDMIKHLATTAKSKNKKWRVVIKDNGLWLEGRDYSVVTPARKYDVGWACLIGMAGDGELRIKDERIWVQPEYGKSEGVGWYTAETMPTKLKRISIEDALKNELRKLKKDAEFEVSMPNGMIARWDAFKNNITAWGEISKKINERRLQRPKISWDEFLREQSSRGGEKSKADWESYYKKWSGVIESKELENKKSLVKNAK